MSENQKNENQKQQANPNGIVMIAADQGLLYALREDGSVYQFRVQNSQWTKVKEIPVAEPAKAKK